MSPLSKKLIALLFTLPLGIGAARANVIIQHNWQYTASNTGHSSDASASFQPLVFTNGLRSTTATATGDARAFEDITGGNNAHVNLVYALDFLVDSSTIIGLSDRLVGSLFLGDTDSAHVDTFVQIIDQTNKAIVASLPIRSHTRSGTAGTDNFDESTPYFQHLFRLAPGDYLLQSGLNLTANATSGFGDDRMESAFSYSTGLVATPEPSTGALLVLGSLALLVRIRKP